MLATETQATAIAWGLGGLVTGRPDAYAAGHRDLLRSTPARHVIVNDTPRTLKRRRVGNGSGGTSGTEAIGPYSRKELMGRLRHVGPGDPPPGQLDHGRMAPLLADVVRPDFERGRRALRALPDGVVEATLTLEPAVPGPIRV